MRVLGLTGLDRALVLDTASCSAALRPLRARIARKRAEQAALEAELEKIKAAVAELEKIKSSVGSLDE